MRPHRSLTLAARLIVLTERRLVGSSGAPRLPGMSRRIRALLLLLSFSGQVPLVLSACHRDGSSHGAGALDAATEAHSAHLAAAHPSPLKGAGPSQSGDVQLTAHEHHAPPTKIPTRTVQSQGEVKAADVSTAAPKHVCNWHHPGACPHAGRASLQACHSDPLLSLHASHEAGAPPGAVTFSATPSEGALVAPAFASLPPGFAATPQPPPPRSI